MKRTSDVGLGVMFWVEGGGARLFWRDNTTTTHHIAKKSRTCILDGEDLREYYH